MSAIKKEHLPYYTYDDYLLWEGDWELIYGVPYAMALLPIDWKIDEDTVVKPDNLVICHKPHEDL